MSPDDQHTLRHAGANHTRACNAPQWFVYVLACADGTLYTGCTTDLDRRLREHNSSPRGARYTRSRRPVKLLASTSMPDRSTAQREETRVKCLTRAQKLELVATWERL